MKNAEHWNQAPEWAHALIQADGGTGTLYWVEHFGGVSQRQRLFDSDIDRENIADMIEPHNWVLVDTRPTPQWNGGGLPPVGTVCEAYWPHDHTPTWYEFELKYKGQEFAVALVGGEEKCYTVDAFDVREVQFRPIRTPRATGRRSAR